MQESSVKESAGWLSGGGELGDLIRAKDWSATSLGPLSSWPQILRTVTGMMLASRAQIVLFWGPEFTVIYNDAYRPVFALKHSWALGKPGSEAWSEIWAAQLSGLLQGVVESGESFSGRDVPFALERHGYPEETYFDVSYDPVRIESGRVGGVYCIVSETTGRVIGERRLRMLRDLDNALTEARTSEDVFRLGGDVLARAGKDISFAVAWAFDEEGKARRVCAVNIDAADDCNVGDASAGRILEGEEVARLGSLSRGEWPEPATRAFAMRLEVAGGGSVALVLGLSPRRPFDDTYRDFVRLVGASFGNALATTHALDVERKRAQMLAELDRAKTAFFSNVSHEFRTPLTLLLAPLEETLAAPHGISKKDRTRLEIAHRNALRLLKLVNTLLDFSRIEAGRARASFEPVDVATLTKDLASNFSSACEGAGLRLEIRCDEIPAPVWVDRDMWEKIILNLVSNAFKFTFEGSIEVSTSSDANGAVVRVKDTGVGIPAGELPRIFERFHRVEGVRSRTHEGSGIGLALVHDLVKLHGGHIEVESAPGRGTCFTIRLPYGSAHLPANQLHGARDPDATGTRIRAYVEEALAWLRSGHPIAVEPEHAPASQPLDDARVLVVDDNADMRDHIVRLLAEHWMVEGAADGEAALERLRAERFDLVVTDAMMPRLDGFGLLAAIRGDPRLADLGVIMLSARAGEDSRIEGRAAGADDYLVKPFSSRELVAQVRSRLSIRTLRLATAKERELLLAAEKDARREAQQERERLNELFMQTPNPILILKGPEHVIELANPAACKVWGRSQEQVLRKPLLEAVPELRGQGFNDLLDEVLRSGKAYHGREMPAHLERHGGQQTLYFNFVYSPTHGADGQVNGVIVSAFDVTEEVLARRQVEELRGKAEEANRTKDAFLAILGHELRNPLSPIVGALKLMRLRGIQTAELDILERQAGHLTRLVDDLLDVSRIARGRLDLRRNPVDMAEVIRRAMDMAAPLIQGRSHAMEINLPAEPLVVMGDVDRLAQVFSNLLTNAAKYSDPGSTIAISCSREGDRILMSVEDQGVGIAPEMQSRIFDLFVQQEQTLDRAEGGLGLGLAIVKNLVTLHGGSVRVYSAGVGQGSRFTIELPVAAATEPRESVPPAMPMAPSRDPLRVLIVDDNEDAVSTLGEALRLMGHSVQTAHSGEEALRVAHGFAPDVALIDIGLPRMDGYEVARRMRAMPNPPKRLFAITGYGLETDRQRAIGAGFHRHFIKPVDVVELDDALAFGEAPSKASA